MKIILESIYVYCEDWRILETFKVDYSNSPILLNSLCS